MTIKLSRPSLIALAVSMSALSSGFTFAAEEMDHSTMDHGSMPMDHSKMNHGAAQVQMGGMDHSQMPEGQNSQDGTPAMDHSKMNHEAMQGQMGSMDHSQMNHGQNQSKAAAMDHSKMGHGAMQEQMKGMDHSNMDHSQMNHSSADTPRTTSRTPIPVLTDADRQAAFAPLPGHTVHDSGINSFFLLDQLEYQDADEGSTLAWDASGWVGGDINRVWFRSEGEQIGRAHV